MFIVFITFLHYKLVTKGQNLLSSIPQIKEFFEDKNQPNEQVPNIKKKHLIKIKNVFSSYGHILKKVVNPPSSGDESNMEEIRENQPSIKDVADTLTDLNTIMIVKNPEDFPREAQPSLILINLDEWVNDNYIQMFLEEIPSIKEKYIQLSFGPIKIFEWGKKKSAIVKLNDYSHCELIALFFYHSCKKKYPTLNSKGEVLEVFMCFDLLELTLSDWYGVILRNLPQNCSDESIRLFCDSYVRDGVKYCLKPVLIKNDYCSIIVMKDLDDAENLCITLNGQEVSKGRKIKVHMHPKICKIREAPNNSQFSQMFNPNGYSFNDNVNESNSLMKKCISLMNLYPKKNKAKIKQNKKKPQNLTESNGKEKDENNKTKEVNGNSDLVKSNTDTKSNNKTKSKTNSVSQMNDYMNESLLSLIMPKKETIKENDNDNNNKSIPDSNTKKNDNNNNNKASNLQSGIKNSTNIIDTMTHLLIKLKENPPNQPTTSHQEEKKLLATPTESETPDMNDSNKTKYQIEEDKAQERKDANEEMVIEYEQSIIDYYTYNMKDQKYYDNRVIEIQEAKKYKNSSNQFVELLKLKKKEIEINREKERKHYINVKSIPINESYSKDKDKDKDKNKSQSKAKDNRQSKEHDYGKRNKDKEYDKGSKERDYYYRRSKERDYIKRSKDRNYERRSKDRDYDRARNNDKDYNYRERNRDKSHDNSRDRGARRYYKEDNRRSYSKERNYRNKESSYQSNHYNNKEDIETRRHYNKEYYRTYSKSRSISKSNRNVRSRSRSRFRYRSQSRSKSRSYSNSRYHKKDNSKYHHYITNKTIDNNQSSHYNQHSHSKHYIDERSYSKNKYNN